MHKHFLDLKLPLLIVGLGKTGTSILELLLAGGVSEEMVLLYDDKIQNHGLSLEKFLEQYQPKTLLVSPGVPLSRPDLQEYLKKGAVLTSELELAFRFITSEFIISVTGSIGKSTVTSLIGDGLKAIDPHCFVGGNLGNPFATYAAGVLKNPTSRARYVVLELSSYQLENFNNLKSAISVLTYFSPNHLERYNDLNHYYSTKLSLLNKTTGSIVCNLNGGDLTEIVKEHFHGPNEIQWVDRHSPILKKHSPLEPRLLGEHNRDNMALSFAVFTEIKAPESVFLRALQFPGLPHRLENLGEKKGILFINDSKATAMDSTIQACMSIRSQIQSRHLIVLIGGKDKNMPWEKLKVLNGLTHTSFRFFGEVGSKAQKISGLEGSIFSTLKDCLVQIQTELKREDIVLLSPGGTSLDEFKSFEDRGNYFRSWVESL